jgi:hypothetical protein
VVEVSEYDDSRYKVGNDLSSEIMMETALEFLDNQANENEGLGDAGIETFKDAPYASAAKEAGQNSRDAMLRKPIKLSFKLHELDRAELPCYEQLDAAIDSCLRRVDAHYNEKEEDFFLKAKDILDQQTIKVLEIADYNTSGLIGPAEEGKPFYALLKSIGVSNKDSDTSAGSFGIGKNASFAISELQTVFYSTVYLDEDTHEKCFLAQGKTKLVSHVDAEGNAKKATGWWGLQGFKEIDDADLVPGWMRRTELGTSVFSIGFREELEWESRVVAALLRTFFMAIKDGEMEFEVGDSIKVDSSNIHEYFHDSAVLQAAEASHASDEFEFARDLFECATAHEAIERIIQVPGRGKTEFGDVSVRILKRQNLPKRLGFVRNGMMITDNLKHFGHPYRTFPMCADFVALIQPMEGSGSALLKKLENPPHDQFSASRISDDIKREEAITIMTRFGKLIREVIRQETLSKPDDIETLNELAEFFADQGEDEKEGDGEAEPMNFKYELDRRKLQTGSRSGTGKGNTGGSGTKKGGGGGGGKPGNGPGAGPGSTGSQNIFPISGERNLETSPRKRVVYLTSGLTGFASIEIEATGLAAGEKLEVSSVTLGEVKGGRWLIELTEEQRIEVEVEFSEDYEGPIEISAYQLEQADED